MGSGTADLGGWRCPPPPPHLSRGKMFLFKYKVHAASTRLVPVILHLIQVEFFQRNISLRVLKIPFQSLKISKYFFLAPLTCVSTLIACDGN